MKFAFFDFDNTIVKGDSIVSFIRYSVRSGKTGPSQWLKALCGFVQQRVVPGAESKAKEKALSFLNGKTETEISAFCHEYIEQELSKSFYAEGVQKMREMRNSGYKTVLVSASTSCYMDLLTEWLPVDYVICTRMYFENGIYTGRVGKNCKGKEKVNRILNDPYTKDAGKADTAAFGDSSSDIPMLKFSDSPTLVNPDKHLRIRYPEIPAVMWKEMIVK